MKSGLRWLPIRQRPTTKNKVKQAVLQFLKLAGNYEAAELKFLLARNANLGISRWENEKWNAYTYSFDEFIKVLQARGNPKFYVETVSKFTVHVDDGQIAFVKAQTVLQRDGIAVSNNIDYFTLIKINNIWKFLNVSYTVKAIEKK